MAAYAFYIATTCILIYMAFKLTDLVNVLFNDNRFNVLQQEEMLRVRKYSHSAAEDLHKIEKLMRESTEHTFKIHKNIEVLLAKIESGIESAEQANKDSFYMLGDIDHRLEKLLVTVDGIEGNFYRLRRNLAPTEREIEFQQMKDDAQN